MTNSHILDIALKTKEDVLKLGISNGDLGYIESIILANKSKSKKNELIINFDGNKVTSVETIKKVLKNCLKVPVLHR